MGLRRQSLRKAGVDQDPVQRRGGVEAAGVRNEQSVVRIGDASDRTQDVGRRWLAVECVRSLARELEILSRKSLLSKDRARCLAGNEIRRASQCRAEEENSKILLHE